MGVSTNKSGSQAPCRTGSIFSTHWFEDGSRIFSQETEAGCTGRTVPRFLNMVILIEQVTRQSGLYMEEQGVDEWMRFDILHKARSLKPSPLPMRLLALQRF